MEPDAKRPERPAELERHRAFVGPAETYDLVSAMQFNLLTFLGLREEHTLLDIGCGSLRAGRLFLVYLQPGNYFGLEPEEWLVREGIDRELGREIVAMKRPTFRHEREFLLTAFGRSFDYLVAQSIFSHTPQSQIAQCLSEAKKVLGPDSLFAATWMKGDLVYTGTDWVYPNCVTYPLAHIQGMVSEARLESREIAWPHPNGQSWLVIFQPGNSRVPDPGDQERLAALQSEIAVTRQRYDDLRRHPWVRLGLWLNRLRRGTPHRKG